MKRIMILGAGVMQLPAFEAARRCGWESIGVDGNPNAPGVPLADTFLQIDLKDTAAIVAAAREERRGRGLDGVFTVGTDFSYPVAAAAAELGLPGAPPEAAKRASDKVLMRRALAEAGVPIPRFLEVPPDRAARDAAEEAVERGVLPAVVKPVDNMGARGVRRVDAPGELVPVIAAAREYSRSGRVIVEEVIDGPEYSIDALVVDGTVHITGVADRHIYFPPYFIELGHTLPAELTEAEHQRLEEGFRRAVEAIGIGTGAAKGDVFLTPRGAVVGEIAARLSGGYMSGWTFPNASGIPLVEKGMRLALGEEVGSLEPPVHRSSAERAAVSIPGAVRRLHGVEEARAAEGVTELFLRCAPGDRVDMPRNNTEKVANVISVGETRAAAVDAAEAAIARLVVELEPGDEATARYLFGEGNDVFPPFFDSAGGPAGAVRRGASKGAPDGAGAARRRRDWNYRTLEETLALLAEMRGIGSAEQGEGSSAEGTRRRRAFDRALAVGGIQGALYAVDTARERPDIMEEYLDRWFDAS